MRKIINNDWYYWDKSDSFALIWNISESATLVNLPHDSMGKKTPCQQSINGGNTGFVDGDVGYYVKKLTITDNSKLHFLEFEGISHNSMIYVNGQFVGENKFGYNKFKVEITSYLNYNIENEIRVVVRNQNQSSRWYQGGGIYRNVYLETIDPLHFGNEKLTTFHVGENIATIEFEFKIFNRHYQKQEAQLVIVFGDESIIYPIHVNGNSEVNIQKQMSITNPKLWDSENPYLYNYQIKLKNDLYCDENNGKFGIRTINYNSENGLLINGKSELLRGACIHHDSGILGAQSYFDYEYYRVAKLKDAGFNAIRMAHNPASSDLLAVCDLLGMYVMEETFDMWFRSKSDFDFTQDFDTHYSEEIKLMVDNDYNHPAVIMYSLGNEIPDIGMDKGIETLHDLAVLIKTLDKSRPTLLCVNGVFAAGDKVDVIIKDVLAKNSDFSGNVNNFMQVMDMYMDDIVIHPEIDKIIDRIDPYIDILGYNYMTNRYQYDQNKNRVIVGSETYPPQIARNWQQVQSFSNIIGDFTWTGWDYIGEAGVGIPAYQFGEGGFGAQFPARLAYCGDFDLIGNRRPLSYFREIVFGLRTNPYITVINPDVDKSKLIKTPWVMSDATAKYWGQPNQELELEIYSPGDRVEIYINEQLIDTVKVEQYVVRYKINYQSGFVRAVTYEENKVIGEDILYSQGDNHEIEIKPILGKSQQLKFIEIKSITNNTIDFKNQQINVICDQLLALGNGDPKNISSYGANSTYTFNGHALAIVKYDCKKIVINDKEYILKG